MKPPVSHLKDSSLQYAPQALLRAAENARLLAEQTGTKFVVRNAVSSISQHEKSTDTPPCKTDKL
jgi:hypothetical protein